jgi:hypothetical protein
VSLGPACRASIDPDLETHTRAVTPAQATAAPVRLERIVGSWRFDRLTGVPPRELPQGALADNRHDLVIAPDGTFTWGSWSGMASGAQDRFSLVVTDPSTLARRFDDYGASITIVLVDDEMRIWLPDLGRDRDVDVGTAVEDIDARDMAFVRP